MFAEQLIIILFKIFMPILSINLDSQRQKFSLDYIAAKIDSFESVSY